MNSGRHPRILIKIARNLGDSLHGQVIMRHYRKLYPDASIVFLTEQHYHGAHEYNTDIDKIFLLPNRLLPQTRLALWNPIKSNKNILGIIPAINPFRSVHKENDWCTNNILDQYLHNAGIKGEPLGGRNLEIIIDDNDRAFAAKALSGFDRNKLIAFEYVSYSTPPAWNIAQYTQFVRLANKRGYMCVSLASIHEPYIHGSIDMRGTTWRQAVALISMCGTFVGCASGMTMLACGSRPQPRMFEIDVPENVTVNGCGYGTATVLRNVSPEAVIDTIANTTQ
ncbi:MAG: hypothetical protein QXU32_01995 [Nitrososphaerales archaeon]